MSEINTNVNLNISGKLRLTLLDGSELVDEREVDNLVTDRMTILLARLASGAGIPGISNFAIGSGVGNGNINNPQIPSRDMVNLRNEEARIPLTGAIYEDPEEHGGTTISDGYFTNRLTLTGELTTPTDVQITEAGLFGGPGASSANNGYMCNIVTFPYITKPSNLSLRFRWQLTFRSI